jgi:hypothetical protein
MYSLSVLFGYFNLCACFLFISILIENIHLISFIEKMHIDYKALDKNNKSKLIADVRYPSLFVFYTYYIFS